MIAGGLISHVYSLSKNEDVNNYSGDIDIWIPIVKSTNLFNKINFIKEKFDKLLNKSNYGIMNEYNFCKKNIRLNTNANNYYNNIRLNSNTITNNYYNNIRSNTNTNVNNYYNNVISNTNVINYYNNIKSNSNKNTNSYYNNIQTTSNTHLIIYMIKYKNKNGKELQLIFINTNNHNVLDNFDLSFCAIGYNGLNLLTTNEIDKLLALHKIGYIKNYNSHKLNNTPNKILKYINRGYTIFKNKNQAINYLKYIKNN